MHTMLENAFKCMKTAMCAVQIRVKIQRNNVKLLHVSLEQASSYDNKCG